MIDEKKLIAEMEKLPLIHGRYDKKNANPYFINGAESMYEMIRELVERQPKVNEWIPCSEKLPEPYESVLVTAKMEGDSHPLTYQGARTGCTFELSGVKNPEDYIVTAWQPEPEPWEGE